MATFSAKCAVCKCKAQYVNTPTDASGAHYACGEHVKATGWEHVCTYFAYHRGALENGSYVRRDVRAQRGRVVINYANYINGDFMGVQGGDARALIPPEMQAFAPADARALIPAVCK